MKTRVFLVLVTMIGIITLATSSFVGSPSTHDSDEFLVARRCDAMRATQIGLLSDTHILRKPNEELNRNRRRPNRVIESVNATGGDLVLIAGDLTEDGGAADFRPFARHIATFEAAVWVVPGNQDTGGKRVPRKPNPVADVNRSRLRCYEWMQGES